MNKLNYLFLTFIIISFSRVALFAQVLDEIDDNFSWSPLTYISHIGGENDHLFFEHQLQNTDFGIVGYFNGNISSVGFPDEIYLFQGQDIQSSYLNSESSLSILRIGHNPSGFEVINLPPNYASLNYAGYYDSEFYLQIIDVNAQNINLAKYDNGTYTIFPSPDDLRFVGFGWPINDNVILEYRSQDNRRFLYQFDGTDISIIDTPPNSSNIKLSYRVGNLLYLTIQNFDNESTLYSYDGIDLKEVSPSGDVDFVGYVGANSVSEDIYLTYKNAMEENIHYVYDGATFTTMSLPAEKSLVSLSNIFEGMPYFNLVDNGSNLESLFKFDTGNFSEVVLPVEYSLESYLDDTDRPIYMVKDIDENRSIAGLDITSNSLQIFADPIGEVELIEYFAVLENKIFTKYLKDSTLTLMMYDGTNYTEVWPDEWPSLNSEYLYDFEKVIVKDNGFLYLSYERRKPIFPGVPGYKSDLLLYKLISANGKPTSDDVMITLDAGMSYSFDLVDFPFQDPDHEDSLHSIIITDINLSGELTLNSQNIELFDTVLSQDIPNMTFNPIIGDTSFLELTYKVGDGLHYSTADYTFTLTVEQTNALPTSADGSVTTFVNETYTFSELDFDFNDEDDMDSLHSILITELGQIGSLKMNEIDVQSGEVILEDMISSLSFVPPADEETTSSFQYKVGDGKDYSEAVYTMTIEVVEDPFVAVEDVLKGSSIDIYPIPTKDILSLKIDSDSELGNMIVKVYNTTGQIVLEKQYNNVSKSFKTQIELFGFSTGTYYLIGQTDIGSFSRTVAIE